MWPSLTVPQQLDGDTLLFLSILGVLCTHLTTWAWRDAEQPITVMLVLSGGAMVAGWLLDRQMRRQRSRSDVSSNIERFERRPAPEPDPLDNALDGELYMLRNARPTPKRPLRYLRQRPTVARALLSLHELTPMDRGMVARVVCVLEEFYARAENAHLHSKDVVVARNLGMLKDLRAEALNVLSTLGWVRPGAEHPRHILHIMSVVRKDTLLVMQALVDGHSQSPSVQAVVGVGALGASPQAFDATRDPHYHLHP
jgi:hypothetical protein